MLVRVVRAVVGSVLLLIGVPLLLAGGALWLAMQHRDADGAYRAPLVEINTSGHAVVASDVDALLRRDVPLARGGRTALRVNAQTGAGPAFVGLAPASDVAAYLADVPYAQVREVRLARGPLPVALTPVEGAGQPAGPPHEQPFWLAASGAGTVEWVPAELRDRQLALVVMARDGTAPLTVDLVAEVRPQWLGTTTFGALVLGAILVLAAVGTLAWPARPREIVYVVPPAQVPEIAAQLGVPVSTTPATEGRWWLPVPHDRDPDPAPEPVPPPEPEPTSDLSASGPAAEEEEPAVEPGNLVAVVPPSWPPLATNLNTAAPTPAPPVRTTPNGGELVQSMASEELMVGPRSG